jgi:hypothetical protein
MALGSSSCSCESAAGAANTHSALLNSNSSFKDPFSALAQCSEPWQELDMEAGGCLLLQGDGLAAAVMDNTHIDQQTNSCRTAACNLSTHYAHPFKQDVLLLSHAA